jgi:hypothetical protein
MLARFDFIRTFGIAPSAAIVNLIIFSVSASTGSVTSRFVDTNMSVKHETGSCTVTCLRVLCLVMAQPDEQPNSVRAVPFSESMDYAGSGY